MMFADIIYSVQIESLRYSLPLCWLIRSKIAGRCMATIFTVHCHANKIAH